ISGSFQILENSSAAHTTQIFPLCSRSPRRLSSCRMQYCLLRYQSRTLKPVASEVLRHCERLRRHSVECRHCGNLSQPRKHLKSLGEDYSSRKCVIQKHAKPFVEPLPTRT